MKLWLHVGAHKTGTTALQDNLWRSRNVLSQYGIIYPDNITGVSFRARQHFTHAFMVDALRHEVLGENLDGVIAHYSNIFGQMDYLFSSEAFGELKHPRRKRLFKAITPRFNDISVILYLRDPASQVVSRAAQKLQHGKTMTQILDSPPNFAYRHEVESWWSLFGRSNVIVRAYGIRETTADLLQVLGLPSEAVPVRNWRNSKPSLEAIEAIQTARINGESWQGKGQLPGQAFTLPQSIIDRAVEEARADLEWLEDTFGITLPTEHFVEDEVTRPATPVQ